MAEEFTKQQIEDNRKALIQALRSGKYEQGRGGLIRDNKFCCLGVACEVLGLKSVGIFKDYFLGYVTEERYLETTFAPVEVVKAFGLFSKAGAVNPVLEAQTSEKQLRLTYMNDSGSSFEEIADALETGNYWKTL